MPESRRCKAWRLKKAGRDSPLPLFRFRFSPTGRSILITWLCHAGRSPLPPGPRRGSGIERGDDEHEKESPIGHHSDEASPPVPCSDLRMMVQNDRPAQHQGNYEGDRERRHALANSALCRWHHRSPPTVVTGFLLRACEPPREHTRRRGRGPRRPMPLASPSRRSPPPLNPSAVDAVGGGLSLSVPIQCELGSQHGDRPLPVFRRQHFPPDTAYLLLRLLIARLPKACSRFFSRWQTAIRQLAQTPVSQSILGWASCIIRAIQRGARR